MTTFVQFHSLLIFRQFVYNSRVVFVVFYDVTISFVSAASVITIVKQYRFDWRGIFVYSVKKYFLFSNVALFNFINSDKIKSITSI